MRHLFGLTAIAALAILATAPAHASITITNPANLAIADLGIGSGDGLEEPGFTSPLALAPGETATFTGDSGVYSGNLTDEDKSPFGNSPRNYLAAEPTGTMAINFATPQTTFSLLWGTIDDYNGLSLDLGGTVLTGADILALFPAFQAGVSNEFITITGLPEFTVAHVTSTSSAFEFDPAIPAPEPASLAVLGAGLFSLGLVRRRR